jgi:hypothetical protein
LLPFVVTLTFTCGGFDSSRFANSRLSTPFLYSALDGFRVHRIRQTEAAAEGTISALDTQVVACLHLLLEFTRSSHGPHVVLYGNVQVLNLFLPERSARRTNSFSVS